MSFWEELKEWGGPILGAVGAIGGSLIDSHSQSSANKANIALAEKQMGFHPPVY